MILINNLKQYPAHFVRRIQQISSALFANACGEFELTPVQFAALVAIQSSPDSDQTSLAGQIGYDRATFGKVLENLEKKAWVSRHRNPENARTRLVRITPQGVALLRKVTPRVQALNAALIAPLNEREQKEFMRLLTKLVESQNDISRAPVKDRSRFL